MFRRVEDFLTSWEFESGQTATALAALTDEALHHKLSTGYGYLGQLAWQLPQSVGAAGERWALELAGPGKDATMPASAATIERVWKETSETFGKRIRKTWTDETLLEKDDTSDPARERGETLQLLVSELIHRRAQMMTVMKEAGLDVPRLYGP